MKMVKNSGCVHALSPLLQSRVNYESTAGKIKGGLPVVAILSITLAGLADILLASIAVPVKICSKVMSMEVACSAFQHVHLLVPREA